MEKKVLVQVNVLGVIADQDIAQQLQESLGRIQGVNFTLRPPRSIRSLADIGVKEMPDILLMDIDGHTPQDATDLQRLVAESPDHLRIFCIFRHENSSLIGKLKGPALAHIYTPPFVAQEIVLDVLEVMSDKRRRLLEARARKGSITAFFSASGGAGATTLATNTAERLVSQFGRRVTLLDLDIGFGCAALTLDIQPRTFATTALTQPERIDPVFIEALLTEHESGLKVLAAPADPQAGETISVAAIQALLHALVERYELLVIDLPRLITPWTLEVMKQADPLFIVTHNHMVPLRNTRLLIEQLPRVGVLKERIEVINNHARPGGELHSEHMRETLHNLPIHQVSSDFSTAVRAQDQGAPIHSLQRRSALCRDIEKLAEYLNSSFTGTTQTHPSLFKRMLGQGHRVGGF
ncbi:Flp pilus assembly protein, ATPase CpaE [Ectothiorhodosinus mongolicus]|uniref:Flp pilus assembly protein, ATPase CpaE n=1 Tax=Ectothiorhodosinus mongolicus TaxID=233100 RepID=A0A1R3VNV7_9GAMM|nr:hypothetical protein [Ectothiorhodosinus mongolicus]ULX57772.1 hypothetical protein CKX93_08995 [Ectothiorhodosinus mongolicus]SIT65635.1 Flp pilus assembly protein, ATPase CpaE [Ectothiorhodosinus mongolicus]